MVAWLAPILGAAGSVVSSLFGSSAAEKANKKQIQAQQQANAYQQKYNKNKIQWLVEDARKAGIHPLAALGSSVAGSFATPVAAYGSNTPGGVGDAIGAGMQELGRTMPMPQDPLAVQLQKAQIANVNASTANMLAEARSRTQLASERNGAISGPAHELGVFDFKAKTPGAAQRAQDDFGDIWEQVFGTMNLGDISVNRNRLGPLGKWLYDRAVETKRSFTPRR